MPRFPVVHTLPDPLAALEAALRARFQVVVKPAPVAGEECALLAPRSPDDLLDEDEFNRDGRIPYWADIWPSAVVLAERLAAESGQGRRLLELGSGLGLAAMAAVAAGFETTATDYYQDALDFTRLNATRHGLPAPAVRCVDWRAFPEDLRSFDVVAGADILYEAPYKTLVAAAIRAALAPHGVAWITDPNRAAAEGFSDACRAVGLNLTRRLQTQATVSGIRQTVNLYEIHPHAPPPPNRGERGR